MIMQNAIIAIQTPHQNCLIVLFNTKWNGISIGGQSTSTFFYSRIKQKRHLVVYATEWFAIVFITSWRELCVYFQYSTRQWRIVVEANEAVP